MRSGSRLSFRHDARRATIPSPLSTLRSTSTPASDDSIPPSNATLTFLRQTDGRSNASTVSLLMTGVALLSRQMKRSRNQNHESNGGFAPHPSLIFADSVNKTG